MTTEYEMEAGADSMDDTDVEGLDVDHTVVDYADVTAHDESFRDFSDEDDHTVGSLQDRSIS